jgi:hypothetical protein
MSMRQEKTASEAGVSTDRQIQIALQAMVDNGGQATSAQIYAAIQRQLPADIDLSEQGRNTIRSLISRNATQKGYVAPRGTDTAWKITEEGREYLDSIQATLGTEEEELLPDEPVQPLTPPDAITEPFNPSAIKVDQKLMTVFQVMRKIQLDEIDLRPDFQRNFVWNHTRQSRLIESILLRIPLPAFYLDATRDGRWLVVDGLQRLTTIFNFYTNHLRLANLEYLHDLNNVTFGELPRRLQRLIEDETELNLYLIQPETPPNVKFTIFSRVNTGGLVLTQQEMRHALFQGRATGYLRELAGLPEFLSATQNSISPLRMDDRECVLRFLAFRTSSYENYRYASLDWFLSDMMARLNRSVEAELAQWKEDFRAAMLRSEAVFERYAFRKMYRLEGRRTQISKPLFETWSVLLLDYELAQLTERRTAIVERFIEVMNTNVEFNKSISYGTGSPTAIVRRFETISTLLQEVMQ